MPSVKPIQTVLAIRLRQLGDVLSTLGSMRALKRAAPEQRIVFVADEAYHPLLRRVDFLDELLPGPPKITGPRGLVAYERYVESVRRLRASCVLDFHSNTRSALLSFLSGSPVRVGFDVRVRKLLYTDVEPRTLVRDGESVPRNSHQSALALVRRAGFANADGDAGRTIPTTDEDRRQGRRLLLGCGVPETALDSGRVVGLNPGNPYAAKAWPTDRFSLLARMLGEDGMAAVVLWGPGEYEIARRVAEAGGESTVLAPRLSLDELPGFLVNLPVIVTIDSGLKHLAVAVGTPTVTLFGPTSPMEWHMGVAFDRYLWAEASCSPCRLLECPYETPCMTLIEVEDVRRIVQCVLRESKPGTLANESPPIA
jgi:ADP-heptose:LPS heptosyltransferase